MKETQNASEDIIWATTISGLNDIFQSFYSDSVESWLAPRAPHISFCVPSDSSSSLGPYIKSPRIYRPMAINKTQIELDTGAQQMDYRVFIPLHVIGH